MCKYFEVCKYYVGRRKKFKKNNKSKRILEFIFLNFILGLEMRVIIGGRYYVYC